MVKTYYVSGAGSDRNNGSSPALAFLNIQTAVNLVRPGDTVFVMNGTYTGAYSEIINLTNKNGTPQLPITIKALEGHKPVLKASSKNWNAIIIKGCSYINIEGLNLQGARDNITLDYALQQKNVLNNPATSGNGIAISFLRTGATKIRSHHITIKNNQVFKFPGGGIATTEADYITVDSNIVSGNAWYTPFGCQGITMLNLWNSDNNVTDYKVIIKGNTCYDNKSLIPWSAVGEITEGHGIMLDTSYLDNAAYTGKALISKNLIYNNGGAGVQIFKGENPVDIVNNTVYQNSQELLCGEVFLNRANNVKATNNIMYAKTGAPANTVVSSNNTSFDNNLAYNGAFKSTGTGNVLNQDPLFVDALNQNFALKPESPALVTTTVTVVDGVSQTVVTKLDCPMGCVW